MSVTVETFTPANTPKPIGPYNHIAKAGNLICMAGLLGLILLQGRFRVLTLNLKQNKFWNHFICARRGADFRQVDTRLVSAARGNLRERIKDGSFRLDFFFRINAVTIELPPLRQRIVDLPMLIGYFFELHSKALRQTPKPLSREMMRTMERYAWPGNIRELENMVRNYVLIGSEDALVSEMVPAAQARLTTEIDLTNPISLKVITRTATQDLEREIIVRVLQANGWNR